MVINDKKNVDSMLRHALSCSETPSTDLVNKIKRLSIIEAPIKRTPYRPRFAVAAIIVLALVLSTAALAATGTLDSLFAALSWGNLGNNSRQSIIDNDFVAEVIPNQPVSADSAALELRAYYIDTKEIGLDFTLSGIDIPEDWGFAVISDFEMEMTYSNGDTAVWSLESLDSHTNFQRRTFPGGHFFNDGTLENYEYEPGQDFVIDAAVVKLGDGEYNVSVIIRFYQTAVPVGEHIKLRIEKLHLYDDGRSIITIANTPVFDGIDEDMRDKVDIGNVVMIENMEFDIEIDRMFQSADSLTYRPASGFSVDGIEITSVTVSPATCRIEARIDFAKTGLGDPNSAAQASGMQTDNLDMLIAKLDMLNLDIYAQSGDRIYGLQAGSHTDATGGIVTLWVELESMYFDAPENITLHFENQSNVSIEIPLVLHK